MSKRTDTHRPSAIKPEEYVMVACMTHRDAYAAEPGACSFLLSQREQLKAHMARTGGDWSRHEHGGNCHICGAYCVDEAVFYHEPTNSYIRTGFDCAEKLDMGDPRKFRKFRKEAKQAEHYRAGKAKAKATLEKEGLSRAWELSDMRVPAFAGSSYGDHWLHLHGAEVPENRLDWEGDEEIEVDEEARAMFEGLSYDIACRMMGSLDIIGDMVNKLVRYGSLSERQVSFLRKLIDDVDVQYREQDRARKAEQAEAEDAPEGRNEITGTVLSVKSVPGFGYNQWDLKMLVKDDRGFRVWGTVPAALNEYDHESGEKYPQKGSRVSFSAALQPKQDDPKFAFYKRPTKAEYIDAS